MTKFKDTMYLQAALEGVDILFIIQHEVEDPVSDIVALAEAAREAGVKHCLLQVTYM